MVFMVLVSEEEVVVAAAACQVDVWFTEVSICAQNLMAWFGASPSVPSSVTRNKMFFVKCWNMECRITTMNE
jgi:hypothetical protein